MVGIKEKCVLSTSLALRISALGQTESDSFSLSSMVFTNIESIIKFVHYLHTDKKNQNSDKMLKDGSFLFYTQYHQAGDTKFTVRLGYSLLICFSHSGTSEKAL